MSLGDHAAPHYVNGYVQDCPLPWMDKSLWLHGHGQDVVYAEVRNGMVVKQVDLLQEPTVLDVVSSRPFGIYFVQRLNGTELPSYVNITNP
jgi:hypothetical protein